MPDLTFRCANCNMEFIKPKSIDLDDTGPSIDDILLCGGCGFPNKITLIGTALLSEADYATMSDEEKADLDFTQRAIKSHLKRQ